MKTVILTAIALSAVLTCSCTSSQEPSADNSTVIGISCAVTDNNSRIGRKYSEAVIKAGGTPFLLPVTEDTAALSRMLDCIDALILTGGEDLNPAIYGEAPHPELGTVDTLRDGYDLYLVRTAASRGIPVLGICRGEQLINIAFGGTLYQDIPTQKPSETDHYQSFTNLRPIHSIHPVEGTWLADIAGTGAYMVRRLHRGGHRVHRRPSDMGSAVPSRRPDRRRRHHSPQHIQIHRLQGPRTPLRKVSVPARPYRLHRFFAENFVNSEITLTFALPNQTKVTDRHGAIAQLVEQRTENPCVPGSIPGGTT